MRPPPEFRRLESLGDEAVDRPGVPEDADRLRVGGPLGVALGDVHSLDPGRLHVPGPAGTVTGRGLGQVETEVGDQLHQRRLDEPRHHAGVGPATGHRRRSSRRHPTFGQNGGTQSLVGTPLVVGAGVVVEALPWFDDGVDVEHAELATQSHDLEGGGVDREVDAEPLAIALGQQRVKQPRWFRRSPLPRGNRRRCWSRSPRSRSCTLLDDDRTHAMVVEGSKSIRRKRFLARWNQKPIITIRPAMASIDGTSQNWATGCPQPWPTLGRACLGKACQRPANGMLRWTSVACLLDGPDI